MKKQLMNIANALRKTGLSLSEALKKAWLAIKLKAEMLRRPVRFFFIKDDGSKRQAVGYYGVAPETKGTSKPGSFLAIPYYDIEVNGWRSFRVDRLLPDQLHFS